MKIFKVMGNSDVIEGRGRDVVRFKCTDRKLAERLASDKAVCSRYGVMGYGPLKVVEEDLEEALFSDYKSAMAAFRKR